MQPNRTENKGPSNSSRGKFQIMEPKASLSKNPPSRMMVDTELGYLLLPPGPILVGKPHAELQLKAEQRLTKACRTCRARGPLVTLMRCNNCKYIYYCSRECQKTNYKLRR
ncbi:hypothetical protein C8R47DRAFT_444050 [Mycena vitilis]|nr:hypothetical protein C8R47DRAFT_444050 [Mycena vitilis]